MEECAASPRSHEEGTWIEKDMIEDYCELHRLGFAHSIEAYYQDELVGGLYGLCLGNSFFGESMFHKMPEASKVCLAKLVEIAQQHNFHFIDCQVPSKHLKSLGACETERVFFLKKLQHSLSCKPENLDWNSIK
jgi:leucyl/phenylalanyl-tRNA--protein transferase